MAPANLFLTTGLSGIRFPWIAHHFNQDIDYTLERLEGSQSDSHLLPFAGSLAGLVTAARWFTSCEQDFQTCGPDFEFTRRLHNELKKKSDALLDHQRVNEKIPVELVFPWLFYSRLSAEIGQEKPGNGFDFVLTESD